MSLKTKILGLFKYDPDKDGASTFNIKQALNDNWDKLDAEVGARVKSDELAGKVKESVKSGGLTAAELGAEESGAVSAHNKSTSAHSAQFAKKQDKIKGTKGKYLGFTANDTVGEVDAPASGGSRITLTFASDFVGQAWTLSGGGETYTGTVDSSLTATVSVLGINTTYTLSCVLFGTTYTTEVTTKAYYTALSADLEKFQSTITVTVDSGSTVTATLGSTVLTKTSTGTAVFTVGKAGTWAIKATKGDQTAEGTVSIIASGQSKALTLSYANVFGVCWDTSNSSTALTRLTPSTDPYGYVTRSVTTEPKPAVGTGSGSSPFDSYAPWADMKECNLNDAGTVKAWKGDSGFSRGAWLVMVYIPEFYVKYKESGTKKYFYISDCARNDFVKHPGSGKFVGRYVTAPSSDGVVHNVFSQTNGSVGVNITRANARTLAKKNGAKYHLYDFATYCAIIWLYLVEFADWNCQSKIGRGYVDSNSSAIDSGGTDSMVYHTGRAAGTDGKTAVQYRWIENLWGNISQWVDGINLYGAKAYVCLASYNYVDSTLDGYTEIGELPASVGGITDLIVTENGLLIPSKSRGSSSTFIPDQVASNIGSSYYVAAVGGAYNMDFAAGILYFNGGHVAETGYTAVSARLMCEAD